MKSPGSFLMVGIPLALTVCMTGFVITNIHFNRENRALLNKAIADKLRIATEAMDRRKWDEAIELLTATKASTKSDDLDGAGVETMAHLERLLSNAVKSKSEQEAEVETSKAKFQSYQLLKSAEEAIQNGDLALAVGRLQRYLERPKANQKARGKLLLDAVEASISDTGAIEFLVMLSDSEFSRIEKSGTLPKLELIDINSLRSKCLERLRKNLAKAAVKRETLDTIHEHAGRYERDVSRIKSAVLADTIRPESAVFCNRFSVIKNEGGNNVYVGWYRSKGFLNGVDGEDNIIAEVNESGVILKLDIGTF